MVARNVARARFDTATRLELVESDADDLEAALAVLNRTLNKILWAVMGLLITVATSSIFLGLNLAVN